MTSPLKTLHGKLSAVLFGLLCLTGLLYLGLLASTTRTYVQEADQTLNRRLARDLAVHLGERGLLCSDARTRVRARAEIKELMAINPSVEVYLLDPSGAVQVYSGSPSEVKRRSVSLLPLRRFEEGARLPILGDDPRDAARRKVFSAAAYSDPHAGPGEAGHVYVILGGQDSDSAARSLASSVILRSSLGLAAAILTLVLGAGLLLFRVLTRRLRWLTASMETFRNQNFRDPDSILTARLFTPWPGIVHRRDEIDRLGMVHLEMTNTIRGQILALAQADTQRRELVGNVSHDLRTPLAALQGYLETLLMKEGELSPAEQREYLMTALRHSERLAALVGELFELARLEAQETQARPEPFALGELAQDMVQQFTLAGEKKGVTLRLEPPPELPFVLADIGLISRVLENLLENAVRHTPAGGQVVVRLARAGDRVSLQVADTGEGIAPEHLPHVTERFYRVPGQARPGGGAGLGLAIAWRILEMHGSRIDVQSEPGRGTTFTFSLPAAPGP